MLQVRLQKSTAGLIEPQPMVEASVFQFGYLPQVILTLAETSFMESLMFNDLPVSPLCVLQRGTMYQLLSTELSFWTCAPTSGFLVHFSSGQ